MKNQIILMAAAALAFASCSKDEMTEVNPGNAIGFRTAVTRATEVSTSSIHSMKVTALYTNPSTSDISTYFGSLEFTNTEDSTSWVSSPTYYWPTSGTMSFYAWAPSTLAPTISSTSKTFEFTPSTTVADQIDFIAAVKDGVACSASAGAVGLPFKHALSEIIIKAKNSNSAYTYKVYGVRIGKVAMSGTYDFAAGSWNTDRASKDKYAIDYAQYPVTLNSGAKSIMDGEGEGATATNLAAMLVPQQTTKWDKSSANTNGGSYISVNVQIVATDTGFQVYPASGTSAWVSVPVAFNWVGGNRYTYVLDFSNGAGQVDPEEPNNPGSDVLGGAIDFNVTVNTWNPATTEGGMNDTVTTVNPSTSSSVN